mgnify:CR=1 FL=1
MTDHDAIEFILDHYESPRNCLRLPGATVVMRGSNPACGDVVTLYLQIDAAQRIERITFMGEGCTISQAAASLTTTKVEGLSVDEAYALRAPTVVGEMSGSIVQSRRRCATLALHTLRAALTRYQAAALPPSPETRGLHFEEPAS